MPQQLLDAAREPAAVHALLVETARALQRGAVVAILLHQRGPDVVEALLQPPHRSLLGLASELLGDARYLRLLCCQVLALRAAELADRGFERRKALELRPAGEPVPQARDPALRHVTRSWPSRPTRRSQPVARRFRPARNPARRFCR